ncbi:hypothetical protein [Streptomyces sp. NPDC002403]
MDDVRSAEKVTKAPSAPRFQADNTGWVSLQGTVEWWRSQIDSNAWPVIAAQMVKEGEAALQPDTCRVIGTTTGRPCRVDTRLEPCPHHGPGNEANRCGASTTSSTSCRWNLVVNGPCSNHPETYERILEEQRAQEAELRRQWEEKEEEAARRTEERKREAEQFLCPYCSAEPGSACVSQGTAVATGKTHGPGSDSSITLGPR